MEFIFLALFLTSGVDMAESAPLVNCAEIQHELELAVESGLLNQSDADRAAENCHRYNQNASTHG